MSATTSLTCVGCSKTERTDAIRPEDWPGEWFIEGPHVWHSRECRELALKKKDAQLQLDKAMEIIEPGLRERLVSLAHNVLRRSDLDGSQAQLAKLTLKMFGEKKG